MFLLVADCYPGRMTDPRQVAGDMPLDPHARSQLVSFMERNKVVVIQPARRHVAGWIWAGRLGEAIEVAGDHEPLRVLTVPGHPSPHIVRFVACLAMSGEIDHVLQVSASFTRMHPVDDPEDLRRSIRDDGALDDFWECPYGNRTRCHCLSRHHNHEPR